ncbi:MAG: hypothetical protein V1807_02265 [Patescibacteria group bacterium]
MIESLKFVGIMTLLTMMSIAIPTLKFSLKKGEQFFNQVNISPYRAILMFSWVLALVLYLTGGQTVLPPLDGGISTHHAAIPHQAAATKPQVPPPATAGKKPETKVSDGDSAKPEETPAAPPSPSPAPTLKKEGDMDRLRGRTPDYLKDDPIL